MVVFCWLGELNWVGEETRCWSLGGVHREIRCLDGMKGEERVFVEVSHQGGSVSSDVVLIPA